MSSLFEPFIIHIFPRQVWTREEFMERTPPGSIAFDGMVKGGPFFDPATERANLDHHDNVVREATLSTASQTMMGNKMGLMDLWRRKTRHLYINDTDQDTAFAVWILLNYKLFEGARTIPAINRLLALNDKLDVTAGSYPMDIDERLHRQHLWVFEAYANLRKSGGLANATEAVLRDNLDATLHRLSKFSMGEAKEVEPDLRYEILYDGPFKVIDEIGGTDARRHLFMQGLRAYLSIVSRGVNEAGEPITIFTVGRRSQYQTDYPVPRFYKPLSAAEKPSCKGWGGSDIVGGCRDSTHTWQDARDIILDTLEKK